MVSNNTYLLILLLTLNILNVPIMRLDGECFSRVNLYQYNLEINHFWWHTFLLINLWKIIIVLLKNMRLIIEDLWCSRTKVQLGSLSLITNSIPINRNRSSPTHIYSKVIENRYIDVERPTPPKKKKPCKKWKNEKKERKWNLSECKIHTYLLYPVLRIRIPPSVSLGMSHHLWKISGILCSISGVQMKPLHLIKNSNLNFNEVIIISVPWHDIKQNYKLEVQYLPIFKLQRKVRWTFHIMYVDKTFLE